MYAQVRTDFNTNLINIIEKSKYRNRIKMQRKVKNSKGIKIENRKKQIFTWLGPWRKTSKQCKIIKIQTTILKKRLSDSPE